MVLICNWAIVWLICGDTFLGCGVDVRNFSAGWKNTNMIALADNMAQWPGKCFMAAF